jgi:hypothetical protein
MGLVAAMMGLNILKILRFVKEELLIVLGTSSSEAVIATDMFRSPCLNMLRIASSRVAPNQKRVNASGVWYEKLRDKIEGRLTRIKRMPQLIRSFFVVYITGC